MANFLIFSNLSKITMRKVYVFSVIYIVTASFTTTPNLPVSRSIIKPWTGVPMGEGAVS